jgi:hypothetical protein
MELYMKSVWNTFGKLVAKMGMLSLVSVMPLVAQVGNGVVFTAPFPFYAGDVEMPAGTYKITQPNMNSTVVLLRNVAGTHGVFLSFTPTGDANLHGETYLRFSKYGDTGYLRTLSVAGETDGMEFARSTAERKTAATIAENTVVVQHATISRGE